MAVAGIDLSLRSPGLVIVHDHKFLCMYLPCRQRDCKINVTLQTFIGDMSFRPIRMCEEGPPSDVACMGRIVKSIIAELKAYETHIAHVFIEGYAFNAHSSSSSKLHEIGGILKYEPTNANYMYTIVPPTKLKLHFTGSGRATKHDMYNTFTAVTKVDIITDVFSICNKGNNIPNPVQDIVDAYALAMYQQPT